MPHDPSPPLNRRSPLPPGALVLLALLAAAFVPLLPGTDACLLGQTRAQLTGVWAAERYLMAEGGEHEVRGRIIFGERDWQVLFFVVDEAGEVRRGSGEGGTYDFEGGTLVFTHLFNLSAGESMRGLPAAELRMVARGPEGAPREPTEVTIEGDGLTLHFPSGNRMTFRRR
jgi:hypothetical protein